MMVSYEPCYTMMNEWWKQLYGESEGKDGKGLFPASAVFSTDLHSLGQFVQDGSNVLFETVVLLDKAQRELEIGHDPENVDGLNFLTGRTMSDINRKAFEGTVLAHSDGGTPSLVLHVPAVCEEELGYLIYFFEKACAVSGICSGSTPSISRAWKATSGICSPCSASRDMRTSAPLWKSVWAGEKTTAETAHLRLLYR